jgi:hypothetical protein
MNVILRKARVCIICSKNNKYSYSEYVSVALYIQHAERIRSIVLTSVVYPAFNIFFTLSHERHDFREKVYEHKICAFIFFSNFYVKHFSFQEELSGIWS